MGRDEERVAYYGPRGYEGEPVPRRLRRMAARLRRQAAAGVWPGCRTYLPELDVPDLSDPRPAQPPLDTRARPWGVWGCDSVEEDPVNFGVRLPGPFRVGVSSSGRVNAGVTAGPFSLSTGVGQRQTGTRAVVLPGTLKQVIAAAVADGFKVVGGRDGVMHVRRRFRAFRLTGDGPRTVVERITSVPTILAWTFVAVGIFLLCTAVA